MFFNKLKTLYKSLKKFEFIKNLSIDGIDSEEKAYLLSKLDNVMCLNG